MLRNSSVAELLAASQKGFSLIVIYGTFVLCKCGKSWNNHEEGIKKMLHTIPERCATIALM
jgi:hypothetical protein